MPHFVKRSFKFTRLTPKLAYVIGTFLGDGSVDKCNNTYVQWSIDKDYVDAVRAYVQDYLGTLPEVKAIHDPKKYKRIMYLLRFGSEDFCKWLLDITDDKRKVPDIIPRTKCEETKAFCEGFIDAEGWVSKSSKVVNVVTNTHAYRSGVCNNNYDLICTLEQLLPLQGVKVSGKSSKPTVNGISYTLDLNLKSLVAANFNFRIARKADRLKEYAAVVGPSTHNKGKTKDNYLPLQVVGDKVSKEQNGMYGKTPWNKTSSTTEHSEIS
jgi:hypothetical protein